ncbi:MAG: ATP-binding protein [Rubritepida sp.]|nr:ATP-binding protein [Rubritepida sp.]
MSGRLRLRIGPEAASIAAAQHAVARFVADAGLGAAAASRAELVVEEVALNALRHGGAPEVRLAAAIGEQGCLLRFEDAGPAFDPTAAGHAPAPGAALGEGGFGLMLARRAARHLAYARLEGGLNRLEVVIGAS